MQPMVVDVFNKIINLTSRGLVISCLQLGWIRFTDRVEDG